MPQIIVLPHEEICPEGLVVEVKKGQSVCNALLENDIEIEHASRCQMLVRPVMCIFVKGSTI